MCVNCMDYPHGEYTNKNHENRDKNLWNYIRFWESVGKITVGRDIEKIDYVLSKYKTTYNISYNDFMSGKNDINYPV